MIESKHVESKIILKQNLMPKNVGTRILAIPKHHIIRTYTERPNLTFSWFFGTQIANDITHVVHCTTRNMKMHLFTYASISAWERL